ncbi:WSC domain-containing protein [Colletotrichum higginsianum IMI 349063]|uniref:Peroxidase n=1 Tax=Colletotrichum higginsianum (strain IMI 349063) TaxID=759273 RepID=A0A1B7YU38_COLHI|nr:WSC domain-containing protein [Colletotrichum higginsianum IMI 349063]OBR15557.1 WSC domain-containing protein [Colletotrichum higginsianum IMI 349063]
MKRGVVAIVGGIAAVAQVAEAAYVWPSKYDEIEDILSLQTGYRSRGFVEGVTPCSFGGNIAGRQFAAEWIRTAFHDVATTDAAAGAGGLDGSIWFELDRTENGGAAFNNTFSFFSNLYSVRASASDLLAMSVVVANAGCGGARMPFRAGRIDAVEAGPAGVPEPDTPMDTTRSTFAKAGFSESEMIALVACGHTLGGVHSRNNPHITGLDPTPDTVTKFDSTFDDFDNKIATEYLKGNTSNPLVVGKNETLNSDKRIFASDGNKTIQDLGCTKNGFKTACADVFTRMIDTVPSAVQLTEPIEAVDIKPYVGLSLGENGSIAFSGRVRVRTTEDTGRDVSDLTVHLSFADRNGEGTVTVPTTLDEGGVTYGLWGETFVWYQFETVIPAASGISKFVVHLTNPSTNATAVYRNGGGSGYPLDDALLYQASASCVDRTSVNNERTFTVTAAVREDRAADPVKMELVRLVRRQGIIHRQLVVETVDLAATADEGESGYVTFQGQIQLPTNGWSTSFDLVLGGGEKEVRLDFLKTQTCPRLKVIAFQPVPELLGGRAALGDAGEEAERFPDASIDGRRLRLRVYEDYEDATQIVVTCAMPFKV